MTLSGNWLEMTKYCKMVASYSEVEPALKQVSVVVTSKLECCFSNPSDCNAFMLQYFL